MNYDQPTFYPATDKIFAAGHWQKRFNFDAAVADVFDDMALRSIPLYREVMDTVGHWASVVSTTDSVIYDLGCSTGSSLAACAAMMPKAPNLLCGIDSSEAMIVKASEKFAAHFPQHNSHFTCADITEHPLDNAGFIILNYTLQFVPVNSRRDLLARIASALPSGGALFLSEKLAISDPFTSEHITERYHRFKEEQGYSRSEIERKRRALENVLIPSTLDEHLGNLRRVGFRHHEIVLKWNQFVSILAFK